MSYVRGNSIKMEIKHNSLKNIKYYKFEYNILKN